MTTSEILRDGFAYPFRENGRMILIWGAILGVGSDLASLLPVLGAIAALILAAYFCAIFFEIMITSASGSNDCIGFPNLTDLLDDLILPFFKVVAVGIFSFAPVILYAFTIPAHTTPGLMLFLLQGVGLIYFPMAILAVGILGTFRGMLPHIVVPSILKAGALYWTVVGILLVVSLVQNYFFDFLSGTFIVGALVWAFVNMLSLMVNGRLLGLLYRNKEEELEWI